MTIQLCGNLLDSSHENKRAKLDQLDLQAVFRVEGDVRWQDLT
ncbi:MAG: hypothetical protein ACK2UM_15740 [Anaerolineales bacterium]